MMTILHGGLPIGKIVNAKAIFLDDAPSGYDTFDHGAAVKFVIDPHGGVAA